MRSGQAQRVREPGRQLAEDFVTSRVAERVVDLLEVVEVDEEERQFVSVLEFFALAEEVVQHPEQMTPVAQTGELVGHRLLAALLAQPLHQPDGEGEPHPDYCQSGGGQGYCHPPHGMEAGHEGSRALRRPTSWGGRSRVVAPAGTVEPDDHAARLLRDMIKTAVGQAMAFEMVPKREAPIEFCNRFEVSPSTFRNKPAARERAHRSLLLPDRTAKPPATSPRRRTSPIG